jgi:putative methionine-R-sulfoxide reductase with GAF domain
MLGVSRVGQAYLSAVDRAQRAFGKVRMDAPQGGSRTGHEVVDLLREFEDVAGLLQQLTDWAVERAPGVEACGLTVEHAGSGRTVTYTGELAARGDERQYELDDGPCLQAMRSGQVVAVDDMAEEGRWGDYPRRAVEAGVRSSLSLPLAVGEAGRGALNLYSSRPRAFSNTDERMARVWAGQASGALAVAWRMAEREDAVEHLHRGMATRQVIGQAVGLLMARGGAPPRRPSTCSRGPASAATRSCATSPSGWSRGTRRTSGGAERRQPTSKKSKVTDRGCRVPVPTNSRLVSRASRGAAVSNRGELRK